MRDILGSQFQYDGFTDFEIDTIGLVGKLMRGDFYYTFRSLGIS